jgi:Protein of unknown function (DUF3618)
MSSSEQIKSDIERTRAELTETVEAIAAKLDVKEQAKRHRGTLAQAAGLTAAALVAIIVVRRLATRHKS